MYRETADWFGSTSPYRPQMKYALDGDRFSFSYRCHKRPHCDQTLPRGRFVEGLWERDVAEFFVAGQGTTYQEINISPTGAWWSCLFSDYRQPVDEVRFEPVIEAREHSDGWGVTFNVALSDLKPWVGVEPQRRRLSVTSILYDPEPHYFAWNHQSGGEPDFHRLDLFRPIEC